MNRIRNFVFTINFKVICGVLGFGYMLYNCYNLNGMAKVRSPLPSSDQVNILFKTIAQHTGVFEAIVNINLNGKYSLTGANFTFDYVVHPISFEVLNQAMMIAKKKRRRNSRVEWDGYLKIHSFAEDLSKQMRVYLALTLFGGFERRRIVAPHFRNGRLGSVGTPFSTFYNLDQLNQLFAANDYPPIVTDKEYDMACERSQPIYVINFVLRKKRNANSPGSKKDVGDTLYEKEKGERWLDCDNYPVDTRRVNLTGRKQLCATWQFNISTLRETVHKNSKCVEIPYWKDGHRYSVHVGPDRLTPDVIFNYLLKPSDMIVNEANAFIERFLERPYVAIHIRSNHISKFPTTTDRCFELGMRIADALKVWRGVRSVYLSTDMQEFGCEGTFEPGHEEYLASISGAVRYNPNATGKLEEVSRTSVAITNVLLLAKSDHLIAMGTGSFHGYVMAQFLREHFGMHPETWSMIRMCENARGSRGMHKRSKTDYRKYLN